MQKQCILYQCLIIGSKNVQLNLRDRRIAPWKIAPRRIAPQQIARGKIAPPLRFIQLKFDQKKTLCMA